MADLIYRDIADVLNDLPPMCASREPSSGKPTYLRRGHKGYWPAPSGLDVEAYNAELGVSEAQAEAMLTGSVFGFDCPGADPLNIKQEEK
jgi:hypothetical protein